MTNSSRIIKLLLTYHPTERKSLTCQEICKALMKEDGVRGPVCSQLKSTISGTLNKMVKNGELKYAIETGPKGGHKYKLP
jgi:hypothetical protein